MVASVDSGVSTSREVAYLPEWRYEGVACAILGRGSVDQTNFPKVQQPPPFGFARDLHVSKQ